MEIKKVNFKEEDGGGGERVQEGRDHHQRAGRVQQQQEGVEHVQEEDRAAVNHRVSTGSVSTSRREGSSRSD